MGISCSENQAAEAAPVVINKPMADGSVAIHLLGEASRPQPIEHWLGEKDSQTRRVGKELISLGLARRVKAPRSQRHLLQKFVVTTSNGRLLRDRLLKSAYAKSAVWDLGSEPDQTAEMVMAG